MKAEEILSKFNEAPSRNDMKRAESEMAAARVAYAKAMRKYGRLKSKVDKEEDAIADKLDKEYPNWRRVLVRELENRD